MYIDKDKPYFVHDPDGNGFTFFATEEERNEYAKECIENYFHDGWSEDVVFVIGGKITHQVQQCNLVKRPPEEEIDEDGNDLEGRYWEAHWEEVCDYQLLPLVKK